MLGCHLKTENETHYHFLNPDIQPISVSTRIYYTTFHKPMSNFFIDFAHDFIMTCCNVRCIIRNVSFMIKKNGEFCFSVK